jgi:uncharacterized protein (TIGR00661 family)
MKILYAIQGTGNGHLSRSMDIVPLLQKYGEVNVLVSGIQGDLDLPFPITYSFKGLSFIFGKKGGVDIYNTFLKLKSKRIYNEIKQLPIEQYDIVINDFEPISAWACYAANKQCISLSHQSAVLSKKAPKPSSYDIIGQTILRYYAPSTKQYGFHFERYDKNTFTPVIRQQIRNAKIENLGHYTVYLPAYDDERILKNLLRFEHIQWHVFSKHTKEAIIKDNVRIFPIQNELFIESLASAEGVICGAGFETPAEALFMKKKLLVVPMKGQYEQQCNAAALNEMGVPVIKSFKKKHLPTIAEWLKSDNRIEVDYPDITERILDHIFSKYSTTLSQDDLVKKWDKELDLGR